MTGGRLFKVRGAPTEEDKRRHQPRRHSPDNDGAAAGWNPPPPPGAAGSQRVLGCFGGTAAGAAHRGPVNRSPSTMKARPPRAGWSTIQTARRTILTE